MTISRLSMLVAGTAVWAACGSEAPTGGAEPDLASAGEASTSTSTPSSSCKSKTDASGPFKEFDTSFTRTITRTGLPNKVIALSLTETERWLSGTTKEEFLTVKLNGQPLFENKIHRFSFSSNIGMFQNYFPPYKGVSVATANVVNGTMFAVVDGRNTVGAPVGTPTASIKYQDGKPGPTVTVDSDVQKAMDDLISATKTKESQCIFNDTAQSISSTTIAAPDTTPHLEDTRSNTVCQVCRGGCEVAAGVCFYFAGASVACGPFVFFCAIGAIAGCTATELTCLSVCDDPNTGGACCPVGCGGEGDPNFIAPPPPGESVGCCVSGDSCLNRSNGLCCSSGTTACAGKNCCTADQTCIPTGSQAGTCCGGAGQTVCGDQCCEGGSQCTIQNGSPTCCISCSSDAQCQAGLPGPDSALCISGCCVPVPG